MGNKIAGTIKLQVGARVVACQGAFSYRTLPFKREAVEGTSGVAGYRESPQSAYIEGDIFDMGNAKTTDFDQRNVTVLLTLGSGKQVKLTSAWWAGDGVGESQDGKLSARWECDPENASETPTQT